MRERNRIFTDKDFPREEKVLLAGLGGQGVMLSGKILALSADRENKFTTYLPSYGAEMRGGVAHCFVRISSEEIASPIFEFPTAFFVFNQQSFDRFRSRIRDNCLVIINSSLVDFTNLTVGKIKAAPLNKLAQQLGSMKVVNMIALGIFLKNLNILSIESVKEVMGEIFKRQPEILELNLEALEFGFDYG